MVSGLQDPPPLIFLLPGDQLLQSGGHLLESGLSLLCRLSFSSGIASLIVYSYSLYSVHHFQTFKIENNIQHPPPVD